MPFNNISCVWHWSRTRSLDLPQLRLRIKSIMYFSSFSARFSALLASTKSFSFAEAPPTNVRRNKSEKMRRNIQIMYFNVFFFRSGPCIHKEQASENVVCRTQDEIHGKCLARKQHWFVPHSLRLAAIFIIKVNECSRRHPKKGDDTHTWHKIDVVIPPSHVRGYGKIFSFDPFFASSPLVSQVFETFSFFLRFGVESPSRTAKKYFPPR